MLGNDGHTPTQQIQDPLLRSRGIELRIRREDLNDRLVSGNKWRKLKYNLLEARRQGYSSLLTFGGAFSNHIHAVAAAGARLDFSTIGIIRGERPPALNPTLSDAAHFGMELHFVSRASYRAMKSSAGKEELQKQFGGHYWIPEGGSNALALRGVVEMAKDLESGYDYICMAVGTGGTMAGVVVGMEGMGHIIGFPVLKGGSFLQTDINDLMRAYGRLGLENWHLETGYHFGGYARSDQGLVDFINSFYDQHGVPLDPIYTGKMMCGIFDMVRKGRFVHGARILAIHTGGLQGIRGFNDRFGRSIQFDPRA